MKSALVIFFVLGIALAGDAPRLTAGSPMPWPEGYRQWVWVSSGLGMSFDRAVADRDPQFGNAFADPASYQAFVQTGRWPDGTMLVMEARDSVSNESAHSSGRFQGAFRALSMKVKDRGQWTYYNFGPSTKPASPLPVTANCYSCHAQNGALDSTFVQFYPTLLEIAKQKGTLRKQ